MRFAKNNVVQIIHHCDDLTTIDSSTKNFVAPEGENTPSRTVVMSSVEASLSTSLSDDDDDDDGDGDGGGGGDGDRDRDDDYECWIYI